MKREETNRADLLKVFKMYKALSTTLFNNFFVLQTRTRGHTAKLVKNTCRLDLRQHFFSEHVVDRWNGLDQYVIDSATVNMFKNGLRRTRQSKMGFLSRTNLVSLVSLALQDSLDSEGLPLEQMRPHLVSHLISNLKDQFQISDTMYVTIHANTDSRVRDTFGENW